MALRMEPEAPPWHAPDAASGGAPGSRLGWRGVWSLTWPRVRAFEAGPLIPRVTRRGSRKMASSMVEFKTGQWLSYNESDSIGILKRTDRSFVFVGDLLFEAV
jgi:hypothetical protein